MTPLGVLAAGAVLLAVAGSGALVLPAVRRSGLGIVHPAVAWLAFHSVFFAMGASLLGAAGAIDPWPAWYVGLAALATAVGVATSDQLARRRGARAVEPSATVGPCIPDVAPARAVVAAALLGLALAAVAPVLIGAGLPLLADDPTSARTELAGLVVQPLRIALPAAVIVVLLAAIRRPSRGHIAVAVAALALALAFTILLASRYLAAELAVALVAAWLLAGRRLDLRVVGVLALSGLLVFGVVQVVRAPERSSGRELVFAVERTVSRVILVQPRTLDGLMDVIPAETPFFTGLTWLRRVAPLVGRDDVPNLGYWIYPRIFPDQDPGVRGYAAPGLIGEAWANFGLAGLGLFVALGIFLERLAAVLARCRTGTADIVAGAISIVVLARTHALGLNGLIVLLVLAAVWRLLANKPMELVDELRVAARWRT